jgi:hypothetical protein
MKTYWAVDVEIHVFLDTALVGGERSASRPCRFIPTGRVPVTNSTGGWVGPRAVLNDVEKEKILLQPGLEHYPRLSSRYTDYI